MIQRSVATVVILTIVTFGIYGIIWYWTNATEMKNKGYDVMHPIMIFIPIANIIFMWKFCGGVEKATNGKFSQVISLILILVLGIIGMALIQNAYNEVAEAGGPASSDPFASR
jgi:Domain of unknown function (DUF4234)